VVFAPDLVESAFHFQFQVQQLHMPQAEMVMTIQGQGNLPAQMEQVMAAVQDLQVVLA
jgi:hypothetical protein